MTRVGLFLILLCATAGGAQTSAAEKPAASTAGDATSKSASEPKPAKPDSVTINLAGGITKEQADAILNELRQIRQLLERQQASAAASPPPAPPEKVSMAVGKGWYSMGREDAPVTLVEFADYQCPFCRKFHTDTFADLKKNYIDTGKVRFISRDLPLEFHENAPNAAEAARCAGDQGKFWEMRNALITNTDLGADAIARYAQSLSLDLTAFQGCFKGAVHKAEIQKDQSDAAALQIGGTPTFVLAKTAKDTLSGARIVGVQPYSVFDTAIRQLLSPTP